MSKQLETLLSEASNSKDKEAEFKQLLLDSEVYVLGEISGVTPEGESEEIDIDPESDISIVHWRDPSGHEFIPFFTSLDALGEAIDADESYICLIARDFFNMTLGETLFLNPDTETGRVFKADEISTLLEA